MSSHNPMIHHLGFFKSLSPISKFNREKILKS
jgi:hypothetical protein